MASSWGCPSLLPKPRQKADLMQDGLVLRARGQARWQEGEEETGLTWKEALNSSFLGSASSCETYDDYLNHWGTPERER